MISALRSGRVRLTARLREVLLACVEHEAEHSAFPTLAELADALGVELPGTTPQPAGAA